jgi:hypothetical protein
MEKQNAELLEYIEEALKIAEEIQAKNKTHNLDVIYLRHAKETVVARGKFLAQQAKLKAAKKKPEAPKTVEEPPSGPPKETIATGAESKTENVQQDAPTQPPAA